MYADKIRELYPQLSPGLKRIADHLLNNPADAAFTTATKIGRAA